MPAPIPLQACVAPAPAPQRRREPPEVRVQQILDAALLAFAERGFAATRMDDIAALCGLSKGGLYGHFKGKDELFEALIGRHLQVPDPGSAEQPPPTALRPLVEWLVGRMYQRMGDPGTTAMLRLLIAEGRRVPELVARWRSQVLEPHWQLLSAILAEAAAQSGAPSGVRTEVLVREPRLILAPAVLLMLTQLIFGEHDAADAERMRSAHVNMLCEWLAPASA
ncbi:TetR/AcrR family transcriptional regulator [Ideonella azotifigens]|uniref:TetR/AcrR family transcriptional regulator n=1 Tax=Ideonella azotifigens TaxID=513160 RepID=A0ABP3UZ43_9BURK|nr:TetR/AcrR family transcriptional regulator [Ideonella azotifigens]MCD2340146.1 TetR/AcrR family transcriptional regulator [Ideonella azotifigens]